MSKILHIVFVAVAILILILFIRQQININDMEQEIEKLKSTRDYSQYDNERLQHELENPDNEELAEKHGYSDPNKEYYHSN